jgi:ankyrin repeat protein
MSLIKNRLILESMVRAGWRSARAAGFAGVLGAAAVCAPGTALAARAADAPIYIANDQASQVKDLLAQGWNPNVRVKGQPAIMQAVRDNAWEVYDVLAADRRTDVNATNPSDETPLMYLAVQGQTARAEALIARGAKVNRLGWTPLHYAASKAHLDTAKLLLADHAIVNAPGPDGTTPLMMAGYSGNQDMVQLLLSAGADASMRNSQGLDAAAWARSAKFDDLAKALDVASEDRLRALKAGGSGTASGSAPAGSAGAAGGAAAGGGNTPVPASSTVPAESGTAARPDNQAPGQAVHGVTGIRLDR